MVVLLVGAWSLVDELLGPGFGSIPVVTSRRNFASASALLSFQAARRMLMFVGDRRNCVHRKRSLGPGVAVGPLHSNGPLTFAVMGNAMALGAREQKTLCVRSNSVFEQAK